MSRYEKQLASQRANWKKALKHAKCPKCGAKVLEISMPDVVCSECSTKYTLAIKVGFIRLESKLIEKKDENVVTKEKEVIVKIRCRYCNGLYEETLNCCPHCGASG